MKFRIIFLLFTLQSISILAQQKASYTDQLAYLRSAQSPIDYVISKTKDYDIVLLGEDHGVKDNIIFLQSLIPKLYEAGVHNLCMEFGAVEMQPKLDSLLVADTYSEQVARDMMFYYVVGWAYKEYADIYKAVWSFNRTLPHDAPKFRVVNLSYRYDWSKYGVARTPYTMQQVLEKGPVSIFRMEVIQREIIDKGQKAIAILGTPHVFTKYSMPVLRTNNENFCDVDDQCTGNRLYRKYPDKVFNILLHQPFENREGRGYYADSPANGVLEQIMVMNDNKSLGFDLVDSPIGDLPDYSYYSICHPNFKLRQLYDGYIFFKPFSQLEGCNIDPDFFVGKEWDEVKKQMPDPDWHTANTWDEYWKQIKDYVDLKKRYKDVIQRY